MIQMVEREIRIEEKKRMFYDIDKLHVFHLWLKRMDS